MIFTFGFGHECVCGRRLASCYTWIDPTPTETPRQVMARVWGRKWSFEYPDKTSAGVDKYGMKLVESNTTDPTRCPCGARALEEISHEHEMTDPGMRWFGESWGAHICRISEQIRVPVGVRCFACGKPFVETDRGFEMLHVDGSSVSRVPWHRDCVLKTLGVL